MKTNSLSHGHSALNKRVKLLAPLLLILGLAGCQNNKVITTVDDSAEYKSARALPPLKKTQSNPVVSQPSTPTAQPTVTPAPNVESRVAAASVSEDDDYSDATTDQVTYSLVEAGGVTRMAIDLEFNSAWDFLTEQLVQSELTVFSRNRAAGRISIGCADIGNEAGVEVQTVGGWSFFNRKKVKSSEYCALQIVERKDKTVVAVLNRLGQEVTADLGRQILNRIHSE